MNWERFLNPFRRSTEDRCSVAFPVDKVDSVIIAKYFDIAKDLVKANRVQFARQQIACASQYGRKKDISYRNEFTNFCAILLLERAENGELDEAEGLYALTHDLFIQADRNVTALRRNISSRAIRGAKRGIAQRDYIDVARCLAFSDKFGLDMMAQSTEVEKSLATIVKHYVEQELYESAEEVITCFDEMEPGCGENILLDSCAILYGKALDAASKAQCSEFKRHAYMARNAFSCHDYGSFEDVILRVTTRLTIDNVFADNITDEIEMDAITDDISSYIEKNYHPNLTPVAIAEGLPIMLSYVENEVVKSYVAEYLLEHTRGMLSVGIDVGSCVDVGISITKQGPFYDHFKRLKPLL